MAALFTLSLIKGSVRFILCPGIRASPKSSGSPGDPSQRLPKLGGPSRSKRWLSTASSSRNPAGPTRCLSQTRSSFLAEAGSSTGALQSDRKGDKGVSLPRIQITFAISIRQETDPEWCHLHHLLGLQWPESGLLPSKKGSELLGSLIALPFHDSPACSKLLLLR